MVTAPPAPFVDCEASCAFSQFGAVPFLGTRRGGCRPPLAHPPTLAAGGNPPPRESARRRYWESFRTVFTSGIHPPPGPPKQPQDPPLGCAEGPPGGPWARAPCQPVRPFAGAAAGSSGQVMDRRAASASKGPHRAARALFRRPGGRADSRRRRAKKFAFLLIFLAFCGLFGWNLRRIADGPKTR